MDLRQLKYFLAVADERHFGRAAMKLNISQPPLSRQIKALETQLGCELFGRTAKGVLITPAGEVFVEAARRIIQILDTAVRETQRVAEGRNGALRVGIRETVLSNTLVTSICARFREIMPDTPIVFHTIASRDQPAALEQQEIDLGLCYFLPPDHERKFSSQLVCTDEFVLALRDDHWLAGRARIKITDLRDEKFVLFPRWMSPDYHDELKGACIAAGFEPNVIQEVPFIGGPTLHLVSGGLGISFVQRRPAELMKPANIVLKAVEGLDVPIRLLALWRRDDEAEHVNSFLALIARPPVKLEKAANVAHLVRRLPRKSGAVRT